MLQRLSRILFPLSVLVVLAILTPQAFAAGGPATGGTVLKTMSVADYTYMLLQTETEEVWVAIPATEIKTGETVFFLHGMEMRNFTSSTLGRTFERIVFSPGLTDNTDEVDSDPTDTTAASQSFADAVKKEAQRSSSSTTGSTLNGSQTSGGSSGAVVPFVDLKVEKAQGENGYTIGELFAKADSLNGKPVRIRGKVVKVSPNIMGKNWIHIQDGTGNPMQNSHDLVITSNQVPGVGQIVVVDGKAAADKDFGYGYKYDVLVENGTFSQ